MDVSSVIMICGAIVLVLGLVFVCFGYKLARFMLPLCGVLIGLGALWAFALDSLQLNTTETWLFMGGAGVSLYILLFFFKRIAGFFAGLLGAGMLLLYTVYALNLSALPYVYPACFALCMLAGLLAVAYKKAGVIVFTALLGACVAAFTGLYLFFEGVGPEAFLGNVIVPLEAFLSAYKYLVAGVALVAAVAGILIQALITSQHQVLPGPFREEQPRYEGVNGMTNGIL